ncbi:delta-like protein C [Hyalella azteca]|uniref:Delta-like protein C n=1 Tax=Hyalella azteca TaxID=294128 RepID=A0A979FSA1_HYAAZ|nr:delta-like protein C [Hyalella azteca]
MRCSKNLCDVGTSLTLDGAQCRDVDECVWRPCLHSGTCYNKPAGYVCACAAGYAGANCEHRLPRGAAGGRGAVVVLLAAGAVLTAVLTVLMMALVVWYVRRRRQGRGTSAGDNTTQRSSSSFETLQLHSPSMKSSADLLYKMENPSQRSVSVINLSSAVAESNTKVDDISAHGCHQQILTSKAINLPERDHCNKLDVQDDSCKAHLQFAPFQTQACNQHDLQSSGDYCHESQKFEKSGFCPSSPCREFCRVQSQVSGPNFLLTRGSAMQSPLDCADERNLLPCTCGLQDFSPQRRSGIAGVDVVPTPSAEMFAASRVNSGS